MSRRKALSSSSNRRRMREPVDMGTSAVALAKTAVRKINLSLSEKSFTNLQEIIKESGDRNMSDIMRFALSLAKLYFDETRKGNVLFIGDQNGKPITRVVFP